MRPGCLMLATHYSFFIFACSFPSCHPGQYHASSFSWLSSCLYNRRLTTQCTFNLITLLCSLSISLSLSLSLSFSKSQIVRKEKWKNTMRNFGSYGDTGGMLSTSAGKGWIKGKFGNKTLYRWSTASWLDQQDIKARLPLYPSSCLHLFFDFFSSPISLSNFKEETRARSAPFIESKMKI